MIEAMLYARDGRAVETVLVAEVAPGLYPELIAWGARHFVRTDGGYYREVPCVQVFTPRELAAMGGP
jgi:hypothetical protein